MRHSLTNVNFEKAIADCSVCGINTPITTNHGLDPYGNRRRYCSNKDKQRKAKSYLKHICKAYGADVELVELVESCEICGISKADLNKPLCVDHCHSTKSFRGVICRECNLGLGAFKDSISNLKNAIDYLSKN